MSDHIPHMETEDLDEDEEEAMVAGESATDPGETARLDTNSGPPITRAKQLLKKPKRFKRHLTRKGRQPIPYGI